MANINVAKDASKIGTNIQFKRKVTTESEKSLSSIDALAPGEPLLVKEFNELIVGEGRSDDSNLVLSPSKLVVTNSGTSTTNHESNTSNLVYINHVEENNTIQSSHRLSGSDSIKVSSDQSGNIKLETKEILNKNELSEADSTVEFSLDAQTYSKTIKTFDDVDVTHKGKYKAIVFQSDLTSSSGNDIKLYQRYDKRNEFADALVISRQTYDVDKKENTGTYSNIILNDKDGCSSFPNWVGIEDSFSLQHHNSAGNKEYYANFELSHDNGGHPKLKLSLVNSSDNSRVGNFYTNANIVPLSNTVRKTSLNKLLSVDFSSFTDTDDITSYNKAYTTLNGIQKLGHHYAFITEDHSILPGATNSSNSYGHILSLQHNNATEIFQLCKIAPHGHVYHRGFNSSNNNALDKSPWKKLLDEDSIQSIDCTHQNVRWNVGSSNKDSSFQLHGYNNTDFAGIYMGNESNSSDNGFIELYTGDTMQEAIYVTQYYTSGVGATNTTANQERPPEGTNFSSSGYQRRRATLLSSDGGKTSFPVSVQAPKFIATSDKRLKENIQPYTSYKQGSIFDLPLYRFDFIDNGSKNNIGCLAQDLQKICPEIVHENNDGYLSIEESKIVYLLLEEVKQLRKELDELKEG